MQKYYVIVHKDTNELLVITSQLPIYWNCEVAKQTVVKFPNFVVKPINSEDMQRIITQHK